MFDSAYRVWEGKSIILRVDERYSKIDEVAANFLSSESIQAKNQNAKTKAEAGAQKF